MEVELSRVVEENQRLCGMLEELTRSYGALYQQLLQVTQHRQHPADLMINRSSLAHVSAISLDYMVLLASISRSPVYLLEYASCQIHFFKLISFNCCLDC